MTANSQDDRPGWAKGMCPKAAPRQFPATTVKRDHSAGYSGKYAPKRDERKGR